MRTWVALMVTFRCARCVQKTFFRTVGLYGAGGTEKGIGAKREPFADGEPAGSLAGDAQSGMPLLQPPRKEAQAFIDIRRSDGVTSCPATNPPLDERAGSELQCSEDSVYPVGLPSAFLPETRADGRLFFSSGLDRTLRRAAIPVRTIQDVLGHPELWNAMTPPMRMLPSAVGDREEPILVMPTTFLEEIIQMRLALRLKNEITGTAGGTSDERI